MENHYKIKKLNIIKKKFFNQFSLEKDKQKKKKKKKLFRCTTTVTIYSKDIKFGKRIKWKPTPTGISSNLKVDTISYPNFPVFLKHMRKIYVRVDLK